MKLSLKEIRELAFKNKSDAVTRYFLAHKYKKYRKMLKKEFPQYYDPKVYAKT